MRDFLGTFGLPERLIDHILYQLDVFLYTATYTDSDTISLRIYRSIGGIHITLYEGIVTREILDLIPSISCLRMLNDNLLLGNRYISLYYLQNEQPKGVHGHDRDQGGDITSNIV